ncbi:MULTISPECIES: glycoside hydrolase family 88 protein [Cupriavidus]|uniref:Unsaturated chondroitin disaccharide hydrolase n=2 Tax=Cupriavidus TaxID=106589 RepID=A0ABM8XYC1_9BURK|nr:MULTISPECIES: glycoside hydrolase family 88 protein [Cupriavidus]CAG9166305.1 Unsaturated chondroitin disaccharide hydrolase [Cupriavidus pinatubonensis]CAG9185373.1 Unsaturated chondroitin disaccharide hydrolase [Cupriavidus laharis]
MSSTLSLSASQRHLFDGVLLRAAQKVAEDEPTLGVEFPHVTRPDGRWSTVPASVSAGYTGEAWSHGNWLCGFWVGLLLAAWRRTEDPRFLTWARERMRLVAQRADDPNTHDIGFIFESSAVPGFHVTGDRWYADIALRAADKLRARLVNTCSGSYLASWGPLSDPRGRCSSAIDTMANLPLLYWAARTSGDGSYRLAAEAHAQMTARAFIRVDGSTYHAVEYNPESGERRRGYTFQGAGDESAWSRGQGWAIYGFVESARESGKVEYLRLAERLADYYVQRLDGRQVPPWDFDATGDDARIKDTAAAAVVSGALIELGRIHPQPQAGGAWSQRGLAMLEALARDEFAYEAEHRGLLRNACYSKPHSEGVVSATMFGDWFFMEALCRAAMPGALQPVLPAPRF